MTGASNATASSEYPTVTSSGRRIAVAVRESTRHPATARPAAKAAVVTWLDSEDGKIERSSAPTSADNALLVRLCPGVVKLWSQPRPLGTRRLNAPKLTALTARSIATVRLTSPRPDPRRRSLIAWTVTNAGNATNAGAFTAAAAHTKTIARPHLLRLAAVRLANNSAQSTASKCAADTAWTRTSGLRATSSRPPVRFGSARLAASRAEAITLRTANARSTITAPTGFPPLISTDTRSIALASGP